MKQPSVLLLTFLALMSIANSANAGIKDDLKGGNYALFKDAEFKLRGNFQSTGVTFFERDLNGYNGNQWVYDTYLQKEVPAQTKEIERWLYHEITLEPSINFYDGTINVHTELYGGNYMWTSDYYGTVYQSTFDPPDNEFYATPVDMEKIYLKSVFLEALTPVGLFLVGRLPDNTHGVMWGLAFPPLPNWSFLLGYSKKHEGSYPIIDELGPFYSYMDTRFTDDYQDRDDQTIGILASIFDDKNGREGKLILAWVHGGSKSPTFTELNVKTANLILDYNRNNWHMHFFASYLSATIAKLTKNKSGELLQLLIDTVGDTVDMLDPERYVKPTLKVEDIIVDPGFVFAGNIAYDIDKLTPEFGFLYSPGGDRWFKGDQFLPNDEDLPGNSSEKKVLKDYLLNEIEDKYFQLISSFGMIQVSTNGIDEFSFHNMKAIKVGGTYRINDQLEFFGQILSAWRTDVDYFEKDYWDSFFLTYTYPVRLTYTPNDTNTAEALRLPVILQHKDQEYHQKIDDHIGTELDARLTWFVKDGLEISLIAAYFKIGGFYKDILTPKPYTRQMVYYDESTDTIKSQGNPEIIYGPYLAAKTFDPKNAWTLQMKFEFRFQ